jgi:hypothetical protein
MTLTRHNTLKGLLLKGLLLGSVALLTVGVLAPSTQGATDAADQVCPRPPDTLSNFRISAVAPNAVAAPHAHGEQWESGVNAVDPAGGARAVPANLHVFTGPALGECLGGCTHSCRVTAAICVKLCQPLPEGRECTSACGAEETECIGSCIDSCHDL